LETILEKIRLFTGNVITVKASDLARKAGNILTRNIVLIGISAATGKLPMKTETLKRVIEELVPARYLEVNLKAFELGYDYVKSMR
jgi:indolepyruvate ferredoxin oxidoreductase beta subunit